MDGYDVVEKLAGVKFDNGVPKFEGPRKRIWDALVSAGGAWMTVTQIARQASARKRQVQDMCTRLALIQTGGVRDGVKYVFVARELPDGRWRDSFASNGVQVAIVPNPMDDTGWRSGGNARVHGPASLPALLTSPQVVGEAAS